MRSGCRLRVAPASPCCGVAEGVSEKLGGVRRAVPLGELRPERLNSDLGEQTDLATINPTKATELRDMLHTWRTSVDAQMPTTNPDYNP